MKKHRKTLAFVFLAAAVIIGMWGKFSRDYRAAEVRQSQGTIHVSVDTVPINRRELTTIPIQSGSSISFSNTTPGVYIEAHINDGGTWRTKVLPPWENLPYITNLYGLKMMVSSQSPRGKDTAKIRVTYTKSH